NDDKLSSYDYYQYFRNIGDSEVDKCLRLFTTLPMDEVRRLEALQDKEINEAKKVLAFEATKLCRGEDEAKAAIETATKTFEQGLTGDNLPVINADLNSGISVLDAFLQIGFVASKGEARRLIKQAGLKINDKVVTDENYQITSADLVNGEVKLSQGKKKHGLIK
ncbi:MAG: tyrosine--tRNA ligase, partial [Alphaproteobacteria bacterium]|nr:tyrosine--tRNA ligase [Alphaproteobacteria bacterium]